MTVQDSRRAQFLQEMGVGPLWRLREKQEHANEASAGATEAGLPDAAAFGKSADDVVVQGRSVPGEPVPQWPVSSGTAAEDLQSPVVKAAETGPSASLPVASPSPWADDVPAWVAESAPLGDIPFDSAEIDEPVPGKPSADEIARMDWKALEIAVSTCTKCRLCETRTRTVFGTGDRQAKWLFVGEGPGYNEDVQGEPFVGPAGKLLDNMLMAMGLRRGENAYIANVVKCRPTGDNGKDRPPAPDEAAACMPYLERQIALIRPTVIVALGKSAALALLQASPDTPVSKLRGQVHRHADVPLVVTYHPAYLLRSPEDKGKAWRDLCLAMSVQADGAAFR